MWRHIRNSIYDSWSDFSRHSEDTSPTITGRLFPIPGMSSPRATSPWGEFSVIPCHEFDQRGGLGYSECSAIVKSRAGSQARKASLKVRSLRPNLLNNTELYVFM
ncbi:hypothetical protein CHS0354_012371 [Potamilus streckersoni]|uniref:Uncharacterized protein n=1 Tax=Potamilus streckersoni TaxID=2493646 RepID=A0AAE0SK02_9BIVA|nr:hypothetical protein CHS0354_012371 [Potamilus streckersoni]